MDLESYAHALGACVQDEVPLNGKWGSYSHSTRIIQLRPDLSPVQRKWVLAHEIGHAFYGHTGHLPRWELEADRYAANLLIRLCDWRRAVQAHDTIGSVADELEVHPRLATIYKLHLERTR